MGFCREAEAMGIRIDDKTLNTFIEELTAHSMSSKDIIDILRKVRQGVPQASFLAILREELMALRYRQIFHQLPADNWVGGTSTPNAQLGYVQENQRPGDHRRSHCYRPRILSRRWRSS